MRGLPTFPPLVRGPFTARPNHFLNGLFSPPCGSPYRGRFPFTTHPIAHAHGVRAEHDLVGPLRGPRRTRADSATGRPGVTDATYTATFHPRLLTAPTVPPVGLHPQGGIGEDGGSQ